MSYQKAVDWAGTCTQCSRLMPFYKGRRTGLSTYWERGGVVGGCTGCMGAPGAPSLHGLVHRVHWCRRTWGLDGETGVGRLVITTKA